jgi:hypothetical protein
VYLIQALLAALLLWLLFQTLASQPDLTTSAGRLAARMQQRSAWLLCWPVALAIPNWGLETLKWCALLPDIGFKTALRGVLAGASLSLVTPQRIGEYGGRLLVLPKQRLWDGLNAKIAGNAAQLLVLIGAGAPAAWMLGTRMQAIPASAAHIGVAVHILLFPAVVYLYLHPTQWATRFRADRWPTWMTKRLKPLQALFRYPTAALLQVLGYALLRYIVYTAQYMLLLQVMGIKPSATDAVLGIAALFFWQTVLPLTPIAGFAVRANLAVWVWGYFGASAVDALAASLLLWIINLFLPALTGVAILFNIRFADKTNA